MDRVSILAIGSVFDSINLIFLVRLLASLYRFLLLLKKKKKYSKVSSKFLSLPRVDFLNVFSILRKLVNLLVKFKIIKSSKS
jgi:hypothetical protein